MLSYIRRLLIVGVGSSANMHLLRHIANKYPELLFFNEVVMVETSADVLKIAIHKLYEVYKKNYKYAEDREEIEEPYKFKEKLTTKNSILLAKEGGAADPDRGLSYYNAKANSVIERLTDIFITNDLSGIIVLGNAGKGTGTLITPALVNDLMTSLDKEVLGFVTLPFRAHKTEIENAQKMIKFITDGYIVTSRIPLFLLDYESAFDIHVYRSKKAGRTGEPKIGDIYKMVISPLSLTISNIIEALNFGEYCSPPMDWSDLGVLFDTSGVGTIVFTHHKREEELQSRWREDLGRQRFLKVSTINQETNVVSIVKSGTGVSVKLVDEISEYYTKSFNAKRHSIYILERGQEYLVTSLVHGFDAREIVPKVEHRKYSWWQRLRGGR